MNTQAGIYSILTADSTLCAMLSTTTAIFNEVAPQGTDNPCIVFNESTPKTNRTKSGVSTLDEPNLQVDIYANTALARNNIAARVRTVLDGYSGTAESIVFQQIVFVSQYSNYDELSEAYRTSQDYNIRQVR